MWWKCIAMPLRSLRPVSSTLCWNVFLSPVKALQVDDGSEFAAQFELACQQKQLPLFVLPPKSPKLNAHVERSHRTHH
jgi:hypothetical protein